MVRNEERKNIAELDYYDRHWIPDNEFVVGHLKWLILVSSELDLLRSFAEEVEKQMQVKVTIFSKEVLSVNIKRKERKVK